MNSRGGVRANEMRYLIERKEFSLLRINDYLAVLTVVHIGHEDNIISYRSASREEREVYHEWLEQAFE